MKTTFATTHLQQHHPTPHRSAESSRHLLSTLIVVLFFSVRVIAQTPVLGFENWTGNSTSFYDSILNQYYGIPNAETAQPDGWDAYYGAYAPNAPITPSINTYGLIKINSPQSFGGMAAVLLHTWYFYGRTSIIYEDTLSTAPVSITGHYKRITEITMNDTLHDGYSIGYAYVLSAANDTLYKGDVTLNDTNVWTSFQIDLLPTGGVAAVDRIFIAFANNSNNRMCTEQGICDLLWLDDIVVNFATTGVSSPATETMAASVYPNPAGNFLNILHHYPASTLLHYEIYDSQGRLCSSGAINKNQTTLTIGELSTGLYLLNLRTPAETTVLRFRRE